MTHNDNTKRGDNDMSRKTMNDGSEWIYTNTLYSDERPLQHIDFNVTDERGRKVGYDVWTFKAEIVEIENTNGYGSITKPENMGVWYCARTHGTRDGRSYGALTRELRARDYGELMDLVNERVKQARKRYTKKASK